MRKKNILKGFSIGLIFGMLIFFVLYLVGTVHVTVDNTSMLPTYGPGDKLLILKKELTEIRSGDVIMLKAPDKSAHYYLKRVVGVEGDTIEIVQGKLYVNGVYSETNNNFGEMTTEEYYNLVKRDSFFVLSDNRPLNTAKDSRQFGTIEKKDIIGKVFIILSSK